MKVHCDVSGSLFMTCELCGGASTNLDLFSGTSYICLIGLRSGEIGDITHLKLLVVLFKPILKQFGFMSERPAPHKKAKAIKQC